MSEAEAKIEQTDNSTETKPGGILEAVVSGPAIKPDEKIQEPLMSAEEMAFHIERYSGLTTELGEHLTRLALGVKRSSEYLRWAQPAAELKKKELKNLYDIEAAAGALQQLIQAHQKEKEAFERSMADQRSLWEQEKAKRTQEDKDYCEDLRIRREREAEEYKQKTAADRLKAQQQLEEELKAVQQEELQKRQSVERDLRQRELKLKEKELEWVQLIQELEQFMSKLTQRTQAAALAASAPAEEAPEKASVTSLKEMLVSQGKRIENLEAS